MSVKIIVTGKHTPENIERFKKLPGAEVRFAPSLSDVDPNDLADAEMLAGGVNRELAGKMPKLRFVQLFSAGRTAIRGCPSASFSRTRTARTGIPSPSTCSAPR